MNQSLLSGTNEILIECVFFAAMLAGAELGYRVGRKFATDIPENTKSQISTVEAAILGVLALLLGFTMSMAVSRFEARKQLVLEEADAIGTSLLRAQLLPAAARLEITGLLHQYVDVRLEYGIAGSDLPRLEALNAQTTRLQTELWSRATYYAQQNPNPVTVGLLLQSLNQTFDVGEARWMAFQNQVPESVIYINAVVGLLSAILVGYSFGGSGRRNFFSTGVMVLSITLVLAVIIDLDRPRSGFIRGSQQPMVDLLRRF